MMDYGPPASALAAEARRRDLPVSIALMLLVGGMAAAVLGSALAVAWACVVMALLIADMAIYRRLDDRAASARISAALIGWNVFIACVFVALPMALWMDGAPAASAAALALWLVGVIRPFGAGLSGGWIFAAAGAAPAALCILIAPSLIALTSAQADWDAATIATLGGGALAVLIVRALWTAQAEQTAALQHRATQRNTDVLRALIIGDRRALLADIDGNIISATFQADLNSIWPRAQWRQAMDSLANGERVYREGWEARAWRDENGEIIGAALLEREAAPIDLARITQPAPIETLARRA